MTWHERRTILSRNIECQPCRPAVWRVSARPPSWPRWGRDGRGREIFSSVWSWQFAGQCSRRGSHIGQRSWYRESREVVIVTRQWAYLLIILALSSCLLTENIPVHMIPMLSGHGSRLYWSHHLGRKYVEVFSAIHMGRIEENLSLRSLNDSFGGKWLSRFWTLGDDN